GLVVLVVVFVVELDAIFGCQFGVLVFTRVSIVRRRRRVALSKPEIKRSRAGLLQFSRLFETAMTTLLHDRAPTLEI
ncbi:MAG: hypothetical protein ACI83Y_002852, partial [Candidatus Azotimanducaceae bacterium]